MSKLFLSVGVLAFGSFISVSGTHAALWVGNTSAMPLTSTASAPKPSCATCDLSRMPRSGDTPTLNPPPLQPRMYSDGRMLRRCTVAQSGDGALIPAQFSRAVRTRYRTV